MMALSKEDKRFLEENKKFIRKYEADTQNAIFTKRDVDDFEDWLQHYSNI